MKDASRIEALLDKIQEDITEIKVTVAALATSKDDQARRLEGLERREEARPSRLLVIISIVVGIISVGKALIGG